MVEAKDAVWCGSRSGTGAGAAGSGDGCGQGASDFCASQVCAARTGNADSGACRRGGACGWLRARGDQRESESIACGFFELRAQSVQLHDAPLEAVEEEVDDRRGEEG